MAEWVWVPIVVVALAGLYLLKLRADARREIGWLRPTHQDRIREDDAGPLELTVIDWIIEYHAANNNFPTWEAIMEHSERIDPAGTGVDLPTAMACYRSAKDRMAGDS